MRRVIIVTSAPGFEDGAAIAARAAAIAFAGQAWRTGLFWAPDHADRTDAERWRIAVGVGADFLTWHDLAAAGPPIVGMRPRLAHSWRIFDELRSCGAELIVFQSGADAFWSARARRLGAAFAGARMAVIARDPSPTDPAGHTFPAEAVDDADLSWCEAEARADADGEATWMVAPDPVQPCRSTPISVCIAFYRHDRYVPRLLSAFAEVEARYDAPLELVIVDDGTPPDERPHLDAALSALRARGHRVERQANAGPGAARNAAAALARHRRLLFFDADNVPFPTLVADLARALDRSGADCVGAGFGIVPPMARAPGPGDVVRWHIPPGGSLVASLFDNQLGDTVVLIRREVFEALGGFPTDLPYPGCEDWRLLLRLSGAGFRHVVHPIPQFYYTDHPGRNAHVQVDHRYRVRSALFDELRGMTRDRLAEVARVLAVQAHVSRG